MEFIKKIADSQLFKISFLNSFSVLLKIGTGLITSKLLAVFVGPSGMALVGNFRNFISSLEGVSTLGFSSGIIKSIAENGDKSKMLEKIISTVLVSYLVVAFFTSLSIFFFSDFFCFKIFGNNFEYSLVIKLAAIVLPFNVVSVLFVSIINGLGEYNKVIFANIIANIICALLSLVFIYCFNTLGALLSVLLVPVILFFVTFFYLPREIEIFKRLNFNQFDFKILKSLASFSFMILPPAILSPIFNLQIRNHLIATVGLNESGFWEAITRISNLYLLFVSTIVSIYFYPKLIKAEGIFDTKEVIWSFYKFILPVFIICMIPLYFLRVFIIELLFTNQFLPVSELFFWQLTGDVFKVTGTILGFLLMAKKNILNFILIEVLAILFLYFASILSINLFGIKGVVIAQACESFVYLLVLSIYFRKYLF